MCVSSSSFIADDSGKVGRIVAKEMKEGSSFQCFNEIPRQSIRQTDYDGSSAVSLKFQVKERDVNEGSFVSY